MSECPNGKQYSASSIRKVFRSAKSMTKIRKPATVHSLRHSFAAHLLENKTNLRDTQTLLGPSSRKITEIYTHVSESHLTIVVSPLNFINHDLHLKAKNRTKIPVIQLLQAMPWTEAKIMTKILTFLFITFNTQGFSLHWINCTNKIKGIKNLDEN